MAGDENTNYTLDLNAGLTQVLADGTNTYLYGLGRIGQDSETEILGLPDPLTGLPQVELLETWLYHLPDALGSVRQLADTTGAVSYAQNFEPYGEMLAGFGESASTYGFAGEWTDDTGLQYLRARYYSPEDARFISADPLNGYQTNPATYNKWAYAFDSPVLLSDPTGLSPHVDCEKIFFDNMRRLCREANGPDNDPAALDAREWFYWNIVELSYVVGVADEGYFWAGEMLRNFLMKSTNVTVDLPGGTAFGRDPGIVRATKYLIPKKADDESDHITPLLHVFLNHVKERVACSDFQMLPDFEVFGIDHYSPAGTYPRAHSTGWWGAFGHVTIDALYSHVSTQGSNTHEYRVGARVDYTIHDRYAWRETWSTPLPLGEIQFAPFRVGTVDIPHEWAISLVNAGRASEYDFTVRWAEYLEVVVSKDFSSFYIDRSLPFVSP